MGSADPMDVLRKAQEDGVLVGLEAVSGLQPRLEIDVLMLTKPNTFNLFILALSELQNFGAAGDKMAYHQLAGIHGLPLGLWDGVYFKAKDDESSYTGYCVHSAPRFAIWHRSYMALFEQCIYVKMSEIVDAYPESVREKYATALQEFRLPYWDYYRPRKPEPTDKTTFRSGVPFNFDLSTIFTTETIMIRRTLDDNLVHFINPLYRYKLPPVFKDEDKKKFASLKVNYEVNTVRFPTSVNDTQGDPVSMNVGLNGSQEEYTEYIHNLIVGDQTYDSFAGNHQTEGSSGNLEAIHNNYHNYLGGGDEADTYAGWMSWPAVAAFDPVFWFHHNNVERYASIWQAAHPDNWGPIYDDRGDDLLDTDNLPFRRVLGEQGSDDQFWTGNSIQDHKIYGSYYEDAYDPVKLKTPEDVKLRFHNLYSWAFRPGEVGAEYGPIPEDLTPLPIEQAQVYDYAHAFDAVPVDVGPVLDDESQVPMATAAPAAEGAPAREEVAEEPPAPPVLASPSEEVLRVDPTPVAPGTSTGKAFTNISENATNVAPPEVDESKYYRAWYIDDVVEKLAFNGPFSIYFFIGEFTGDDTGKYAGQASEAGFTYIFTSSRELCDNCGRQGDEGQLVTDTNPITPILLDYIKSGNLENLTPEKVVPFLIANLRWRIITIGGQRKDPRTTPGFKVGISSKLTPKAGDGISGFLYQEFPQIVDKIIERAD